MLSIDYYLINPENNSVSYMLVIIHVTDDTEASKSQMTWRAESIRARQPDCTPTSLCLHRLRTLRCHLRA